MLEAKLRRGHQRAEKASIYVERLEVRYGSETALYVDSLHISGPGLVQVLGPNGAGKTTLLRSILGLIRPAHGRVRICGEDVTANPRRAGKCTGYVPQLISQSAHYPITPRELVRYELRLRGIRASEPVEAALRSVDLPPETWDKPLRELSGGQRQRAFIARALAHDPPILLMDEPFSAVDPRGRASLARLIGGLGKEKLVVVTSHDPMLLLPYTSTIVLVNRKIVAVGRPGDVLNLELLEKIYGEAVLWVEKHVHISDSHAAP